MVVNMDVRSSGPGAAPKEVPISGVTAPLANQEVDMVRELHCLTGVRQVAGPQLPGEQYPPFLHSL